ncbi:MULTISPECIES: hypothetical protein [Cyanophyceae]|nr:hypothetical protein [Trichocoleus sp. FACHB-69]MBD1932678.1 hypothetical protein [Trichocoleus sp. FACHB-69]
MATSERKKRILDHVSKTVKLNQANYSTNSDQRKQQIMDHIKRTRN